MYTISHLVGVYCAKWWRSRNLGRAFMRNWDVVRASTASSSHIALVVELLCNSSSSTWLLPSTHEPYLFPHLSLLLLLFFFSITLTFSDLSSIQTRVARWNTGYPVKFEFLMNSNYIFIWIWPMQYLWHTLKICLPEI